MNKIGQVALILGLVLVYFIFPIDFIPDFIPGLGQLDDLAVLGIGGKKAIDVLKTA